MGMDCYRECLGFSRCGGRLAGVAVAVGGSGAVVGIFVKIGWFSTIGWLSNWLVGLAWLVDKFDTFKEFFEDLSIVI